MKNELTDIMTDNDHFEELSKAFMDMADGGFPTPETKEVEEEAEEAADADPVEEPEAEEEEEAAESDDAEEAEDEEAEPDEDDLKSALREIRKLREELLKKDDKPTREQGKLELLPFVANEEEFEKVTQNPAELNAWANRLYYTALRDAKRDAVDVANQVYASQLHIAEVRNRLYTENPDLRKHERVVRSVASEIEAKNPNILFDDPEKFLRLLVKESRKEANLKAPKPEVSKSKARGSFVKQNGGARVPSPGSKNPLQDEMAAMLARKKAGRL